jgi:hypothetical protein
MKDEYDSLVKHQVFNIISRPNNQKIIGGRWVYNRKSSASGKNTYKARYVAKGFQQAYGVHYMETWSPTVSTRNVRLLFAIAALLGLRVGHLDVKTAFLNASLKENDLYVELPFGYSIPNKVMHLKKALYGLKQAGKAWHATFHESITQFGFKQCRTDPCLYHKSTKGCLLLIAIHVDDALFTFDTELTQKAIIKHFSSKFEITYLGDATFALGLEIKRSSNGFHISQSLYVDEMLKRFGFVDCYMAHTPGFLTPPTLGDKASSLSKFSLNELAGSLIWLAKCTRPDISFVTSIIAQQVADPKPLAFQMCSRVLRYLQGTKDLGIQFVSGDIILSAYADSDWAGDITTRRSQSGHVVLLANGPVNWASKKQDTVALSTSEAEIVEACHATTDILAITSTIEEFEIKIPKPVRISEDNTGAIALSETTLAGRRTKHIDIKWHFINDAVAAGKVKLVKVPTAENVADIFTKVLAKPKFEILASRLVTRHSTSLLLPQTSTPDQDGPAGRCQIPTAHGTCRNKKALELDGKAFCHYHARIQSGIRCQGTKVDGTRCKSPPRGGDNYCPIHEPTHPEGHTQSLSQAPLSSFASFFSTHNMRTPALSIMQTPVVAAPESLHSPTTSSPKPRQVEISSFTEIAALFESLAIGERVILTRIQGVTAVDTQHSDDT